MILQNKIQKAISCARLNLMRAKLQNASPRNKWQFIKKCTNSINQSPRQLSSQEAEVINDKFCGVFKQEDVQLFDFTNLPCEVDTTYPRLEAYEISLLLDNIKSFATGPDGLPGLLLKNCSVFFAEPLAILFNLSLSSRKLPLLWKKAHIVPIPKGKDEYRPISLLCQPMKVLEKLVLSKWLMPSLNRAFSNNQFAFIPNVKYTGCCSALRQARIWTLKAINDGASYVNWVAVDLKKAFDAISHKIILETLSNHFRVQNGVLLWLADYLTSRQQGVIIDHHSTSRYLPCSSGVPQGSILGPVLFATILDPCQVSSENVKLIAYADDCTLLNRVFPGDVDTFQCILDLFIQSTNMQGLDINPSKCQCICFPGKRHLFVPPPNLSLSLSPLPAVSSIKILGVWFCSSLKWSIHLSYIYKKCAKASFFIKLLYLWGLRGTALWNVCMALVFSHLAYCWPVFCDASIADMKPFLSLEKRLLKLCSLSRVEPLRTRLDMQCIKLAKRISNCPGHPLEECFRKNPSVSTMCLRKPRKFLPLTASSNILYKSFTRFAC